MEMKFLFACLLMAGSFLANAQSTEKAKPSEEEQQKFTRIHKYVLDHPFDVATSMQRNVKALKISESRLTEIFQARAKGEKIALTKKETEQLAKLKLLMLQDQNVHEQKLAKFMSTENMKYATYQKLEKRYHENPKFQEEVNKLSKSIK